MQEKKIYNDFTLKMTEHLVLLLFYILILLLHLPLILHHHHPLLSIYLNSPTDCASVKNNIHWNFLPKSLLSLIFQLRLPNLQNPTLNHLKNHANHALNPINSYNEVHKVHHSIGSYLKWERIHPIHYPTSSMILKIWAPKSLVEGC